jgi:RimJ/RimL family protein N-acetyltransferase
MLKWAVDYLKNEGAKELEIGVNRFNIAAQKLYLSVGFSVKAVYEEGMTLHMEL